MVYCQDHTGTMLVLASISKRAAGGFCIGSVWEMWGTLVHPSSKLDQEHALTP